MYAGTRETNRWDRPVHPVRLPDLWGDAGQQCHKVRTVWCGSYKSESRRGGA